MSKPVNNYPQVFPINDSDIDMSQFLIEEHFAIKDDDKYSIRYHYDDTDHYFTVKELSFVDKMLSLTTRYARNGVSISLEDFNSFNKEFSEWESEFNEYMDSALFPLDDGLELKIVKSYVERHKRDFKSFLELLSDLMNITLIDNKTYNGTLSINR